VRRVRSRLSQPQRNIATFVVMASTVARMKPSQRSAADDRWAGWDALRKDTRRWVFDSLGQDARSWLFDLVVNVILQSPLVPRLVRSFGLRSFGMQIQTYDFYPRCTIRTNKLRIGRTTLINMGCHFDNDALVEIGSNVAVAMQVTFVTSTHDIGPSTNRAGPLRLQPISVGDGCWIGARATILPGVIIGHGCVIAAGSVVTADCAPGGLYAGVPARLVRELGDDSRGHIDGL
jgi:maltose O-acetyltransferase